MPKSEHTKKAYQMVKDLTKEARNSPHGYVATAFGIQETELNAETKHWSAKREK